MILLKTYTNFLFTIILLAGGLTHATIHAQENVKYAHLRKRLKEQFLKVGPLPGESIPGGRIYQKWDSHTKQFYTNLEFGDATIHLGWYLAVLATENHLLKKHEKSTKINEEELYYALHALERLDQNSNIAWSYAAKPKNENAIYDTASQHWIPRFPVSEKPDGFFLRDDVPPFFFQKFKTIENITSDFTHHTNPVLYNTFRLGGEESKDQLVSILFGLYFVHRFVDEKAEFNHKNIKEYNWHLTKTIMDFVRYEKYNKIGNWKISNPGKQFENPHLGYDPVLFSYPLAVIGNEIVHGTKFRQDAVKQSFNEHFKKGYHNMDSRFTKQIFIQLREKKVILDKNHDWHINYYMINLLAATSNVWAYNLAFDKNSTSLLTARCSESESKGWLIYPLINQALFPDNEVPYSVQYVEDELALYPVEGSYNYFNTKGDSIGKYTPHWFSSNRFQSANGHYEGNPEIDCNSYFNGSFNGLDYMMLYNLYRIVYNTKDDYFANETID